MDWAELFAQRPIVISCAVAGAVLAVLGSVTVARRLGLSSRVSALAMRLGNALMWISIAAFIASGFLPQ